MPSVSLPRAPSSPVSNFVLSVFAILIAAAAPFTGPASRSALAQGVVAPTCPEGYDLKGNSCVRTPPAAAPSSPGEFASTSSGPWAFITREVFGVKSAKELDGATYCAVEGSPSADAAKAFFEDNGLDATHVKADSAPAAMEAYQKARCDVLVVDDRTAQSTASNLKPAGDHKVLPETIGDGDAAPRPAAAPAAPVTPVTPAAPTVPATPTPPSPDLDRQLQAELKRIGCLNGPVDGIWGSGSRAALQRFSRISGQPVGSEPSQAALDAARSAGTGLCPPQVQAAPQAAQKPPPQRARKPRCSAITYAYTRGNTCACAGGRIFAGSRCVRPRF